VGFVLVPFMVVGPLLVVAYNAELFGGRVHTDLGFALAWGAFPLLTGYVAQADSVNAAAVLGAAAAFAMSYAQRSLSTPARRLRRKVQRVEGTMTMADGTFEPIDEAALLMPLERTLHALACSMVALAAALVVARLY
jgi:hypothetical protein